MAIRTELVLRLQNSPGTVARVCQALADERVNILALSLEASGTFRAVVDNHIHAAGILRERQYDVLERDVLYATIPNDPGAFAGIGRLLSDARINIEYAYGSGIEGEPMAALIIGVDDVQRASAASGI